MKNKYSSIKLALYLYIFLCNTAIASDTIEQELLAVLTQATKYYNENNIDRYVSLYTRDAIHISIRRPMVQGKASIKQFFEPGMKVFSVESKEEIVDLEYYGDTANLLFNATLIGKPRKGIQAPSFTEKRLIMIIFKRIDQQWLIHRYIATNTPTMKPS